MAWLAMNLLVLLANLGVLQVAVKLVTEATKGRKLDAMAQGRAIAGAIERGQNDPAT